MALHVTLDLSTLASGLVAKNRPLGLRPRALFLATRPEARAYKSNVTRRAIHYLLLVGFLKDKQDGCL